MKNIRKESISATHRDGRVLVGERYLPEGRCNKYPTVIFCHGFSGEAYRLEGYAEILASNGFACCIFDFYGGSNHSLSGGTMMDMSVMTEVEDLRLVMRTVLQMHDTDAERLFIGGESQGGLVAALVASKFKSLVAGLILVYPAFNLPDMVHDIVEDEFAIPMSAELFGYKVSCRYIEDIYCLDAYSQASDYKGPVLIVHGTRDRFVPISYSYKLDKVYKNSHMVTLRGANHGIYGGFWLPRVCNEIVRFLRKAC